MSEDAGGGVGVADSFAELMSNSAESAAAAADPAPYGYTVDRVTGQTRPKKSPGRPRTPSLDELKSPADAAPPPTSGEPGGAPDAPPADRPPSASGGRRGIGLHAVRAPEPDPVPYRPGVITKGVNKLYRKAGKIVRAMDADIGEAIIQAARNTSEEDGEDDSVGAAWDELARTNPRVRRFIMKALAGGAIGQLVLAHAPIGLAIIMKPAILRLIPFSKVIESLAEPDDDTPPGDGGLPGGLTMPDVAEMQALAERQARAMGMSIPPEVAARMATMAQSMMTGRVPARDVSRETNGAVSRETSRPGTLRKQPARPPGRAARKTKTGS